MNFQNCEERYGELYASKIPDVLHNIIGSYAKPFIYGECSDWKEQKDFIEKNCEETLTITDFTIEDIKVSGSGSVKSY